MEGRFLLVFAYCTLVVAHDQSGSIPDSIAACEGPMRTFGNASLTDSSGASSLSSVDSELMSSLTWM